jgi:hypothetical protein
MKAKMQAAKAKTKAKKAERKYDESQAYNKNLSPEARLHYLENERADKDGASMYGKGPNVAGAAAAGGAAAGGLTLAHIGAATGIAATVLPPLISVGKKVIKGIESLGEGKGFKMKGSEEFKKVSQAANDFSKTETGKNIMQKGLDAINKKMGKEKGPDLLGMGKKETKGALGGALAGGLLLGPLGAVVGGLAGKAFGKGRDRKEAEEGTGANMMGNSISKHMGGRGANMYGEGANMMGIGKMQKANRKDAYEHLENLKDIVMAPGRVVAKAANIVSGDDPKTPKEARQERREERREERQERRAAKAGGPNMEGKKPMMKGENVIVRDAKSGGKKQYNKRGK